MTQSMIRQLTVSFMKFGSPKQVIDTLLPEVSFTLTWDGYFSNLHTNAWGSLNVTISKKIWVGGISEDVGSSSDTHCSRRAPT